MSLSLVSVVDGVYPLVGASADTVADTKMSPARRQFHGGDRLPNSRHYFFIIFLMSVKIQDLAELYSDLFR